MLRPRMPEEDGRNVFLKSPKSTLFPIIPVDHARVYLINAVKTFAAELIH